MGSTRPAGRLVDQPARPAPAASPKPGLRIPGFAQPLVCPSLVHCGEPWRWTEDVEGLPALEHPLRGRHLDRVEPVLGRNGGAKRGAAFAAHQQNRADIEKARDFRADRLHQLLVIVGRGKLANEPGQGGVLLGARGGKIVLISDARGIAEAGEGCMATIEMPQVHPLIAPLVYAVPVQLLAYHTAVLKGTDVDQPRNLAKSVTVE